MDKWRLATQCECVTNQFLVEDRTIIVLEESNVYGLKYSVIDCEISDDILRVSGAVWKSI